MKKHTSTIVAASLILLLQTGILTTYAASSEDEFKEIKATLKEQIGKDPIRLCQQNLVPAYDVELMDFLKFLEANFQNKSSNSSLTNIAISRYAKYKNNIEALFAELRPGVDGETYDTENQSYIECSKISEGYISLAKTKMIEHIKNTNAQKKTTVMLEKYQAINKLLRDLNFRVAEMYGYFMTFKEKLPGFLQECIQN